MIKRYLFILIIVLIAKLSCLAQIQHDYNWILGYPPNNPDNFSGGVMLNFSENIASPHFFDIYYGSAQAAIISTKNGKFIGYSNGCVLIDSTLRIMSNGDSINYGYVWNGHCGLGYPGTQNKLLLPWPNDSNKYLLVHMRIREDYSEYDVLSSIFETNPENPNGVVIEKNIHLLSPGASALVTATRHANGRDWWIIIPEAETNGFFTLLFDPTGISIIDTTYLGTGWGPREWASQAVFSPDGTKYIRHNPWKGIDIFDFDRCSGQLSNVIESGPLADPVLFGGGAGVSVNSQYLYVSNVFTLHQYDLFASDIFASQILIDTFDHYFNPFPTNFYQMMLAPDGKIYMFSTNGVKSMHVIHSPNKRGKECNFVQHGIELPVHIFIGSVNFPYFRLGPEDGSSCDTLTINNSPIADFRYYPDSLQQPNISFTNLSYFNPETFEWDFGNGQTSTLKDPGKIIYVIPGEYEACLTVSNSYGSHTFCRNIIVEDSITTTSSETNATIDVFPNPLHNILQIKNLPSRGDLTFELFTILGQPVMKSFLTGHHTSLDMESIGSGVYYYKIMSGRTMIKSGTVCKI